jgi:hypothetical protein
MIFKPLSEIPPAYTDILLKLEGNKYVVARYIPTTNEFIPVNVIPTYDSRIISLTIEFIPIAWAEIIETLKGETNGI